MFVFFTYLSVKEPFGCAALVAVDMVSVFGWGVGVGVGVGVGWRRQVGVVGVILRYYNLPLERKDFAKQNVSFSFSASGQWLKFIFQRCPSKTHLCMPSLELWAGS